MATVSELIRTPEWWFTVIFVGLLVSLIAAFLKDWISIGLAKVFQTYRGYYVRMKEREERELHWLVENPSLLAIRYAQLTFSTVIYLACLFLGFVTPAYGLLVHKFPEIEVLHPMHPELSRHSQKL